MVLKKHWELAGTRPALLEIMETFEKQVAEIIERGSIINRITAGSTIAKNGELEKLTSIWSKKRSAGSKSWSYGIRKRSDHVATVTELVERAGLVNPGSDGVGERCLCTWRLVHLEFELQFSISLNLQFLQTQYTQERALRPCCPGQRVARPPPLDPGPFFSTAAKAVQ